MLLKFSTTVLLILTGLNHIILVLSQNQNLGIVNNNAVNCKKYQECGLAGCAEKYCDGENMEYDGSIKHCNYAYEAGCQNKFYRLSPGLHPDPYECKYFIECGDRGDCYRKECGPGTMFDPSILRCNHGYDNQGCRNKIFQLPPGLHPYPPDCRSYLECGEHSGCFQKYCGPGTVYDPQNHVCNFPSAVPGCQKNNKNRQVVLPAGLYQDTHDCRAYLNCPNGINSCVRSYCPQNHVFVQARKGCVPAVQNQMCTPVSNPSQAGPVSHAPSQPNGNQPITNGNYGQPPNTNNYQQVLQNPSYNPGNNPGGNYGQPPNTNNYQGVRPSPSYNPGQGISSNGWKPSLGPNLNQGIPQQQNPSYRPGNNAGANYGQPPNSNNYQGAQPNPPFSQDMSNTGWRASFGPPSNQELPRQQNPQNFLGDQRAPNPEYDIDIRMPH